MACLKLSTILLAQSPKLSYKLVMTFLSTLTAHMVENNSITFVLSRKSNLQLDWNLNYSRTRGKHSSVMIIAP
jgi:hypothetical protein